MKLPAKLKNPISILETPVVRKSGVILVVSKSDVKRLINYFKLNFTQITGGMERRAMAKKLTKAEKKAVLALKKDATVDKKSTTSKKYAKKAASVKSTKSAMEVITTEMVLCPRFGVLTAIKIGSLILAKGVKYPYSAISMGEKVNPFKFTATLKTHQVPIVKELKKRLDSKARRAGSAGVTLQLKAGLGKSIIAMAMFAHIGGKVMICVPKISLIEDWIERITLMMPGASIGWYYGAKKRDGDIVICVARSLCSAGPFYPQDKPNKKNPDRPALSADDFFKRFHIGIFDESHSYTTDDYIKGIWRRCQFRVMLGLTATPNSNSMGFDRVSHDHCGQVLYADTIEGFVEPDVKFTGSVRKIEWTAHPKYAGNETDKAGNNSVPLTMGKLLSDPHRMLMVIEEVRRLIKDTKRRVLVLADRRSWLEEFRRMYDKKYPGEFDIPILDKKPGIRKRIAEATAKSATGSGSSDDSDEIFLLDEDEISSIEKKEESKHDFEKKLVEHAEHTKVVFGGSSTEALESAKKYSRIILSTYQYFGTGVSEKGLDTLVLATPRKSLMEQYGGRIQRLNGDSSVPRIIVDIVDKTCMLKKQFSTRAKYYQFIEFPVSVKKLSSDDFPIKKPKTKKKKPEKDSAEYFQAILDVATAKKQASAIKKMKSTKVATAAKKRK